MGVVKYESRGKTYYRINTWLIRPDGTIFRFRQGKIPTKEMAVALLAKAKAESFEGRFFDRRKEPKHTVSSLIEAFLPISKRDKRSWRDDLSRAAHLRRTLGNRVALGLTQRDVDEHRTRRLAEVTQRGGAPSPATLDREVALLKTALNYAVQCGRLERNPIATVPLLNVPNIRQVTVDEALFEKILAAADPAFQPFLVVAYDTGMRKDEVRLLCWSQVNWQEGFILLSHADTKTKRSRRVYLTDRATAALKGVPRHLTSPYVFTSPRTGTAWAEVRHMFERACQAAGAEGVWFHDLRRSFVTNARRRGVAESVVMRMSGHRTRSVFDRYNVVDDTDVKTAVTAIEVGRRKEAELAGRDAAR